MSISIQKNVSLSDFSTLQVGGEAEYFVKIKNETELAEAVEFAKKNNLSITVIAGGSNVLFSDEGLSGLIVKNEIVGYEFKESEVDVLVTVGAGEVLDDFILTTIQNGWWGLENLSHIPGSIGATPIQNVGAYGVEVKDVIDSVEAFDVELEKNVVLKNKNCQFNYRDSIFKHSEGKKYIVTKVVFFLSKNPNPKISYKDLVNTFPHGTDSQSAIREAIISIRSQKFPDWKIVGTAGSFFKNPIIKKDKYTEIVSKYPDLPGYFIDNESVKIPLGYVFDKILNIKGKGTGNVGCYEGQALVLVNHGEATAKEIISFAEELEKKVQDLLGIKIEKEVTIVN